MYIHDMYARIQQTEHVCIHMFTIDVQQKQTYVIIRLFCKRALCIQYNRCTTEIDICIQTCSVYYIRVYVSCIYVCNHTSLLQKSPMYTIQQMYNRNSVHIYTSTHYVSIIYICIHKHAQTIMHRNICVHIYGQSMMGWLQCVGALKLQASFGKEPYKRDDILQKRPIVLRSLLMVPTHMCMCTHIYMYIMFGACLYLHMYMINT